MPRIASPPLLLLPKSPKDYPGRPAGGRFRVGTRQPGRPRAARRASSELSRRRGGAFRSGSSYFAGGGGLQTRPAALECAAPSSMKYSFWAPAKSVADDANPRSFAPHRRGARTRAVSAGERLRFDTLPRSLNSNCVIRRKNVEHVAGMVFAHPEKTNKLRLRTLLRLLLGKLLGPARSQAGGVRGLPRRQAPAPSLRVLRGSNGRRRQETDQSPAWPRPRAPFSAPPACLRPKSSAGALSAKWGNLRRTPFGRAATLAGMLARLWAGGLVGTAGVVLSCGRDAVCSWFGGFHAAYPPPSAFR